MQDWESLKVILSNLYRELDQVRSDIEKGEKLSSDSTREHVKLEEQFKSLQTRIEHRADKIEEEAKEFRKEVYRLIGNNKVTLIGALISTVLGAAIATGNIDYQKVLGWVFGASK